MTKPTTHKHMISLINSCSVSRNPECQIYFDEMGSSKFNLKGGATLSIQLHLCNPIIYILRTDINYCILLFSLL